MIQFPESALPQPLVGQVYGDWVALLLTELQEFHTKRQEPSGRDVVKAAKRAREKHPLTYARLVERGLLSTFDPPGLLKEQAEAWKKGA